MRLSFFAGLVAFAMTAEAIYINGANGDGVPSHMSQISSEIAAFEESVGKIVETQKTAEKDGAKAMAKEAKKSATSPEAKPASTDGAGAHADRVVKKTEIKAKKVAKEEKAIAKNLPKPEKVKAAKPIDAGQLKLIVDTEVAKKMEQIAKDKKDAVSKDVKKTIAVTKKA